MKAFLSACAINDLFGVEDLCKKYSLTTAFNKGLHTAYENDAYEVCDYILSNLGKARINWKFLLTIYTKDDRMIEFMFKHKGILLKIKVGVIKNYMTKNKEYNYDKLFTMITNCPTNINYERIGKNYANDYKKFIYEASRSNKVLRFKYDNLHKNGYRIISTVMLDSGNYIHNCSQKGRRISFMTNYIWDGRFIKNGNLYTDLYHRSIIYYKI